MGGDSLCQLDQAVKAMLWVNIVNNPQCENRCG